MGNSPNLRYGPIGYGNNKMPRWMRLIFEQNIQPPNSHRLRRPSIRARRVRRVRVRPRSISLN